MDEEAEEILFQIQVSIFELELPQFTLLFSRIFQFPDWGGGVPLRAVLKIPCPV